MATLIIYMTSHGCAEKAAGMIREMLPGEATLINLENFEPPPLEKFDKVIIGGSIRIGSIQKKIRKFCEKNLEQLLTKKTGLYICCMFEGDTAIEQFNKAFPEPLRKNSIVTGLFGGELEFEKMNAFERMIIKQVANISVDVSKFNQQAVKEFAQRMTG
ncbi:MAG: flavodoxin domain-containing protein [Bacteroidales bacterium]|nr:flavodoxin domain-containing protein [Bacteroidales bacterium]